MPLWQLFVPEDAYTSEEKRDLAERITNIYSSAAAEENFGFALPRFYTSVVFHDFKSDSFFVGGEPRDKFIQIEVVHIARRQDEVADLIGVSVEELMASYFRMVNEALKPYIADRGYECEFHIEDAPFETWKIDGLTPPPPDSEEERRWARDNRSSPFITA